MENWQKNAQELRSSGAIEQTLGFLNQMLEKDPDNAEIYYQIAWTHDALGKEADAVSNYEKAIALGLHGKDLESAYLGLGSTLRSLGDYQESRDVFEKAMAQFPDNKSLKVFSALTLYNLQKHDEAFEVLLTQLLDTTADASIKKYERALRFYSKHLNSTFE